jgi:hypothetical protein
MSRKLMKVGPHLAVPFGGVLALVGDPAFAS